MTFAVIQRFNGMILSYNSFICIKALFLNKNCSQIFPKLFEVSAQILQLQLIIKTIVDTCKMFAIISISISNISKHFDMLN